MKKLFFILFATTVVNVLSAQDNVANKIYVSDIDNFWIAFDSVQTTDDTVKQTAFIRALYLNKATPGLQEFIKAKGHTAEWHLENITKYPKFWTSIRPNTMSVKANINDIELLVRRFQRIYPEFRIPNLYFTIGCLNSGGTTSADKLLIGTEIASANAATEASELNPWLQSVFKDMKGIMYLVAHEMVHTQQKEDNGGGILLGRCIVEGAADFIGEMLLQETLVTPYLRYGKANEKNVWKNFKKEMYGTETKNWLYNGNNSKNMPADLGYFVGYAISKRYYENAKDKQKAIKDIIQLNYLDEKEVSLFLKRSKYGNFN